MKRTFLPMAAQNGAGRISAGPLLAIALVIPHFEAGAQEINLGTAGNYAVLAGTAVTSTGATAVAGGNVGVSPGSSVTGLLPAQVAAPYTIQSATAAAAQAQTALTAAYNQTLGLASSENLTGQDLGGMTLTPGVYTFDSSAQLTGTLRLDGEGLTDPVFVFQIGTSLTTATASLVTTFNDDGSSTPGADVFWQVGSSATLGTTTSFEGNILALTSITADTGATDLDGRFLAQNGAVTLDDNAITAPMAGGQGSSVPDSGGTFILLGSSLTALFSFAWRYPAIHRQA